MSIPRVCSLIVMGWLLLPAALPAALIREVKVVSRSFALQDEAFVFAYLGVHTGDEVDQRRIARDVKTLLGDFEPGMPGRVGQIAEEADESEHENGDPQEDP